MRSRIALGLVVVVALPFSLTLWVASYVAWTGLWGVGNLGYGLTQQSPGAVSRGLGGISASLGAMARVLGPWSAVLGGSGQLPTQLAIVGSTAGAAAPVAPDMLGFNGPKRYMVSALNDAELFGSGGAPLDLIILEVEKARVAFVDSGSMAKFNPDNKPYEWPVTGSLPWYRPGRKYPFANSNFHPDFRFSGTNMLAAWQGLGNQPVDGVVTVDVAAIAVVLQVLGPIQTEGYGEVSSDNVVRKVLVDSYRQSEGPGSMELRQQHNSQLRSELLSHVDGPLTAARVGLALWSTAPARHIQVYLSAPGWEAVAAAAGVEAALDTPAGDIAGVFTQSGVSKLAIFQDRRITVDVVIAHDGSAEVTQKVYFGNAVPEGLPGDPDSHEGYLALIFRQRVAFRIPESAQATSIEVVDGRPLVAPGRTGPYEDEVDAKVLWQGQDIRAGESSTTILSYSLPAGTFRGSGGLRYQLTCNPQAMVKPVAVEVNVRFTDGAAHTSEGWSISDDGVGTWRGTLDRTLRLELAGPNRS